MHIVNASPDNQHFNIRTERENCSNFRTFTQGCGNRKKYTVNVLKLRTLKNKYFSVVRNFRNYVCEKILVFEILECGLYHEKKRYICMSKCGRNVVKTGRYDSVLSPLFIFFFF